MNVSFTADGFMHVVNLKSKLIAVTANKRSENTFHTALELGLSGEPMSEYISYDASLGIETDDITSVTIQYDAVHSARLHSNTGSWKFEAKSRVPSLQCIRCIPTKKGYRFRNFVTECSKEDTDVVDKLSMSFLKYSDLISRSEWLRLINGINCIYGQRIVELDSKLSTINFMQPSDMSDELFCHIKSLYEILGMSLVPIKGIKKVIMLNIDTESEYSVYDYKLVSVLAGLSNIAHVIFTNKDSNYGIRKYISYNYQLVSV